MSERRVEADQSDPVCPDRDRNSAGNTRRVRPRARLRVVLPVHRLRHTGENSALSAASRKLAADLRFPPVVRYQAVHRHCNRCATRSKSENPGVPPRTRPDSPTLHFPIFAPLQPVSMRHSAVDHACPSAARPRGVMRHQSAFSSFAGIEVIELPPRRFSGNSQW